MPDPVTTDPRRERAPGPRPLLRTILGRALRRIRREQGRTLAEVARSARVSMPYLSELERGRKEASSEVLAAISDALEVDLPDLLAEVGRGLAIGSTSARTDRATPRARSQPDVQARLGNVVRLDDYRSRRTRTRPPVPAPRGPGDVVLLRAA